jgi:peptidoglycan/xylan/chitin deacetylase (PgdA/CDA1 family)
VGLRRRLGELVERQVKLSDTMYRVGDPLLTRLLAPPFGGRPHYVNHGPRDRAKVALTFDDGPCLGATEAVMDALHELGVPGTFFCVGANVAMNQHLVERLDRQGHTVGSHSQRHSRGAGLSLRDEEHITDAESEIEQVLGRRPALYRPPWGWLTPWEGRRLRRLGYTIVGWDVYTLDWKLPEPDAEMVAASAVADTRPGSIYCFHDAFPLARTWHKTVTVESIRRLVPRVIDLGFEFTTVDEMLGVPAYRPVRAEAAA